MTARTFVYGTLTTFSPLLALVTNEDDLEPRPRIFAKKSLTSSVEECPYIVYKLGNETTEDLAEDQEISRQYFQVWVHDFHDGDVADYDKIDAVVTQVRKAFRLASSTADGVWIARYLETSQDLNDDTLNTVFRYVRFQLIKKEM
jgi:hypothetical protein